MMTGNRFRARADECVRAANSMADPQRKLAHLDLAERWLRLATQIDKIDSELPSAPAPQPNIHAPVPKRPD
jgi:hypothetical protein